MLKRLLANEKVRFLLIGGINTAIGYALFVGFYKLMGSEFYLAAYIASYAVSLLIGYSLQRTLVFRVEGHRVRDLFRYSTVQLGIFVVNLLLLPLAVEVFLIEALLAQAAILILTVIGSYFAHRYFSFRRESVS